MFQDEAGFGRINKPKYCWCDKGIRPSVLNHKYKQFFDTDWADMNIGRNSISQHHCFHAVSIFFFILNGVEWNRLKFINGTMNKTIFLPQ